MDVQHLKTSHDIYVLKLKGICNDFLLHEWKIPPYLSYKALNALPSSSYPNENKVEKRRHKGGFVWVIHRGRGQREK